MASKLVQLFALTSLAIFASTFSATPVGAVATGAHHHLNRQIHHEVIAKRNKRTDSSTKRCKPRPTTSLSSSAAPTSVAVPTTSEAPQSTSKAPAPASSSAAASSSAPAATSTPPSGGGSGGGKVGLAWANGPTTDLQYYATSSVEWIYSWSPYTPDPDNKYGKKFMAMFWGDNQISDFESVVKAGYANFILGFNEPNEPGQSNMTPEHGADLWKQYIEPKRSLGYQTCTPATSSNPNGFTWVANWLDSCAGGCTYDYVCVHWYDVKAADFKTYVTKWHDTYNKPVFITEFAPQNFNGGAQLTMDEVWAFYQEIMPWIMQTDWIAGAFPFGFMKDMQGVNTADQLMSSDGKPTDLGYYIINGNY